jgi:hypothetical protein
MEPHSVLGALRCPIDPAISRTSPFNLMVGGGRNQDNQGGKKTIQRNGDLHIMEPIEGEE